MSQTQLCGRSKAVGTVPSSHEQASWSVCHVRKTAVTDHLTRLVSRRYRLPASRDRAVTGYLPILDLAVHVGLLTTTAWSLLPI
jgi:hypothetical protein